MAPVLSFTSEQLSDCYQKGKTTSIHLQDFNEVPFIWEQLGKEYAKMQPGHPVGVARGGMSQEHEAAQFGPKKESQWEAMRTLRSSVLKAIEKLRQDGKVKHSLEAKVTIAMNTSQEQAQKVAAVFDRFEVEYTLHDPIPGNHFFQFSMAGKRHPDFLRYIGLNRQYARSINNVIPEVNFTQSLAFIDDMDLYHQIAALLPNVKVIRATSPIDGKSIWMECRMVRHSRYRCVSS